MSSIWDSALWIRLSLGDQAESNEDFRASDDNRAHLGAQLLLYDTIIIPTKDFGIVPILHSWCGTDTLMRLLESNVIRFVWHEYDVAYQGNGCGLIRCCVEEPDNGWENWRQVCRWGPMEDAASAHIDNMLPDLPRKDRTKLCELVLKNSVRGDARFDDVRNETVTDFREVAALNQEIANQMPDPAQGFSLNRLPGVEGSNIKIAGGSVLADPVDLVLQVAELNNELVMASTLGSDLGTRPGAPTFLREKLKRNGASASQLGNFISLLDLEKLPDIRPAVAKGEITIAQLAELREKGDAIRFRVWLHATDARDPRELEQAYVAAIGADRASKLPFKLTRFAITTAVGFLGPLGVAAGAVDSFFVDRWINGYSPRLFIEDLMALPLEPES